MLFKRGEIYYADLEGAIGSEQGGTRPIVIIQNDVGNKYSPTVIIAPITSQFLKTNLPTHIQLVTGEGGLSKNSTVLLEQIRTIDKIRIKKRMGSITNESMNEINKGLAISIGLDISQLQSIVKDDLCVA